jgi:hypothetical protein
VGKEAVWVGGIFKSRGESNRERSITRYQFNQYNNRGFTHETLQGVYNRDYNRCGTFR